MADGSASVGQLIAAIARGDGAGAEELTVTVGSLPADALHRGLRRFVGELVRFTGRDRAISLVEAERAALYGDAAPGAAGASLPALVQGLFEGLDDGADPSVAEASVASPGGPAGDAAVGDLLRMVFVAGRVARRLRRDAPAPTAAPVAAPDPAPAPAADEVEGAMLDAAEPTPAGRAPAPAPVRRAAPPAAARPGPTRRPVQPGAVVPAERTVVAGPASVLHQMQAALVAGGATMMVEAADRLEGYVGERSHWFRLVVQPGQGGTRVLGAGSGRGQGAVRHVLGLFDS